MFRSSLPLSLLFLAACAGTPDQAAMEKEVYCQTKAAMCAVPLDPGTPSDVVKARALACAVNVVCLPPAPVK